MAEGTKIGDVYFQIGADLSEFNKALRQAQGQGETLGQSLRRSFGDIGAIISDTFRGRLNLTGAFSSMKAQVGSLGSALKSAFGSGLQTIFNGSMNIIKRGLGGLASAAREVGRGFLLGIGAFGLTTLVQKMVTAIPDLINQGKAFGQVVADVTQVTGIAGERASKFVGVLELMGAPMQNIVQLLAQFQRNIQTPAVVKAFAEIGISIYDMNGNIKDAITLLDEGRQAIERLGIGSETIGNIQRAFGRGGIKVFDDYIRMSTKDMDSLVKKVEEMGLVMSSAQAQLAENMNWTMNQWNLTITGIGVGLFETLGPMINSLLSALSDWVSQNRDKIVDFFASISASVIGFVAGLFDANLALQSFADSLDSVVRTQSATEATMVSRAAEVARLEQQVAAEKKAGATASRAATQAIEAQTKALDAQAKELQELDAIQEKVYRRALRGINAQLDAQLALMDAEEKRRQQARSDAQLAEALQDAREKLNQAQDDLMHADQANAEEVSERMRAVAQARESVADAQRNIAETQEDRVAADRRAQIQAVKDYISGIDDLVSNAISKTAALRTLGGREDALQKQIEAAKAAGDTIKAGDIQAELNAIRATQVRLNQEIANQKKQDTIATLKEQLAQERSLITSTSQSITAQKLADAKKALAAAEKNFKSEQAWAAVLTEMYQKWGVVIGGAEKESLPTRFRALAEETAKWVGDFKEGLATLVEDVGKLGGALGAIFDPFLEIWNKIPEQLQKVLLAAFTGAVVGSPLGPVGSLIGATTAAGATAIGIQPTAEGIDKAAYNNAMSILNQFRLELGGKKPTKEQFEARLAKSSSVSPEQAKLIVAFLKGTNTLAGWARGGMAGRYGPEVGWLGEKGPEFVLNNRVMAALNRLNAQPEFALAGVASGGGGVIEHHSHIYLDGREVAEVVDRYQADKRRY